MKQYVCKLDSYHLDYLTLSVDFKKNLSYIGFRDVNHKYTCTYLVPFDDGSYRLFEAENGLHEGFGKYFDKKNNHWSF